MNNFQRTIQYISGKEAGFSVEERVFNLMFFILFVQNVFYIISFFLMEDADLKVYGNLIYVDIFYFLFCALTYYLGRVKHYQRRELLFYLVITFIVPFYFFGGGSRGPMLYITFGFIIMFLIIVKAGSHKMLIIAYFTVYLLVMITEYLYPEFIYFPFVNNEKALMFNKLNFFITSFWVILGVSYFKKMFDLEREKNIRQRIEIENESIKRSNFFIHLAHETRTPLTLINNYLECYIEEEGENEKLNIVKENIDKLNRDMLNFMNADKLNRGLVLYNHEQIIDLSKIIRDKIILFNVYAKKNNINFSSEIAPDLHIKADPAAIETIVNNIVGNAIKFTPQAGNINIELLETGNIIEFKVQDSGPGIPVDEQEKVFDAFYQITSDNFGKEGMGVGLSLVRGIVSELGGELTLNSAENAGAEFIISLNKHELEGDDILCEHMVKTYIPELNHEYSPIEDTSYEVGRKNIMIVEDNLELQGYLRNKLQQVYNVFLAENGEKALQKLQSMKYLPQLIICDVMMPEMDGFAFLKNINASPQYNIIPFLFLTARTTQKDKLHGLGLGAIDYIYKPFSNKELMQKVESVLLYSDKYKGAFHKKFIETISEKMHAQPDSILLQAENFKQNCEKYGITRREKEIVELIRKGNQYKEIGERCKIAESTVVKHVQNMFEKLNVKRKVDLLNALYQ